METAPLTLAQTHARNAVFETRKSNPVAASEEHDLAAGEFASAAKSSSDPEDLDFIRLLTDLDTQALRTLQLLEQHHKKLAEILRFQHEHPSANNTPPTAIGSLNIITQSSDSGAKAGTAASHDPQGQPPRLPGHPRLPSRESSSIASNLASARGIPAHPSRGSPVSPTLSSQQAGAKMIDGPSKIKTSERLREAPSKNRASRESASRQPWSPPLPSPTDITSQQLVPLENETPYPKTKPTADEPFQRFYSTFEGLISRISAPLAFAGLPLGADDSAKGSLASRKSPAETKVDRYHATSDRASVSADPDVSRIFSRAALRSTRETSGLGPGNPAESFYVVPTTGGTMSYTGIMTRAEKEARRNSLEDGEDDFVDARETPSSPEMMRQSAGSVGRTGRRGTTDKQLTSQNSKTLEELQMENQALKHLSDTLSKRLHMWEVNAQSSSMALQQSLRAIHHHNTGSPEQTMHGSAGLVSPSAPLSAAPAISEPDPRIKELEDIVRRGEKELARIGHENDKLKDVLGRYRDRWEKLKEGAKTRRAEGRSSEGQSNTRAGTILDTPLTPLLEIDSSKKSEPDKKTE
ncbi:hypothetical protein N7495_001056 [Penicillium taxi]|uniref:uncharacterized protein n=1 Tax=Penicillium taxi TaxID=168475 RepID=UPI0025458C55|nr:uncharacterized protein N7495_001056 [Penicillium taxi]KAJ5908374.1 hypothetical protein N7495_001056 [Penicillium taxi]